MRNELTIMNRKQGIPNGAVRTRRRTLLPAAACVAVAGFAFGQSKVAAAGPFEDGRIAIIHANQSTIIDNNELPRAALLRQLQGAGVKAIGRYLARCREGKKGDGIWTKQIIRGGMKKNEEVDAILDGGFGLISIYQYRAGERSGPIKLTRGLGPEVGTDCEITAASVQIPISKSPADEGMLDSQAAVKQAHLIGQPPNTPIYFAIDYDFKTKDKDQANGLLEYFRQINAELRKKENGFLVGAYGDGDALDLLMGNNEKKEVLADFAWLSPSHSFTGTSKFFNTGRWHLAHSQSENAISLTNSGLCFEFEYDGDIQNKSSQHHYVGAWDRAGRYVISQERTAAIFDQRRFVCNIEGIAPGIVQKTCNGQSKKLNCSIPSCFARFVRIKPTELGQRSGKVTIDFYDYGRFDGDGRVTSLTRSLSEKPLWWNDNDRPKQNCTCFGSDPQKPCQ